MTTQYRVIYREDNKVVQYSEPNLAATFLMGKQTEEYLVVKTDRLGDRVVHLPPGMVGRGLDLDRITNVMSGA